MVSEHDWYRSRIRREPVPTSPYRVDRVWLEQGEEVATLPAGARADVFERLVGVEAPYSGTTVRLSPARSFTGIVSIRRIVTG